MAVLGTQTTQNEQPMITPAPNPRPWGYPSYAVYPGVTGGGTTLPVLTAGGGISVFG